MIEHLQDLSKCKGHTTIFWNARSVLSKIEEIDRLAIEAKPEFIGVETWINPTIDNAQLELDGYNSMRSDRTEASGKKTGGGLLWYYHEDTKCTPMPELNYCDRNIEFCVLRLNLVRTRAIYMVLVYRPPSGSITDFLTKLEELITTLRAKSLCEINCAGDFNIDLLKRDNRTKIYRDFSKRLGLTNVINDVTHIKQLKLGFSQIDHFLTTNTEVYCTAGTLPTNASDHFFVYANRKKPKTKHPKSKVRGRAYSKLDENKFITNINNRHWGDILNLEDSETAWELFRSRFTNVLHEHAPLKVFNTRRDRQPWVTTQFLE